MDKERPSLGVLYRKNNALARARIFYILAGPLSLYVVNEYPKSGGTWVGQMLGRALGVPFPRNRFPNKDWVLAPGEDE